MPPRVPVERPTQVYRNDPWAQREGGYPDSAPMYDRERDPGFYGGGSNGQIAQLQAAATGRRADTKGPVEFNHAINYVNKIKVFKISDDSDGRLVSLISRISTRISWKFFRLINVNRGRSLKFTLKSLDFLKEHQICWTILNSSFLITVHNNSLEHPSPVEREVCLLWEVLLLHRLRLLKRNDLRIQWNQSQWALIDLLPRYALFEIFLMFSVPSIVIPLNLKWNKSMRHWFPNSLNPLDRRPNCTFQPTKSLSLRKSRRV